LVELVSLDQELKQSVWCLSTVLVDDGHVKIINKQHHLLARRLWSISLQRSLINILFDDVLEVLRGGSRREVDIKEDVPIRVQLSESRKDSDGLGGTRVTTKHDWSLL